MTRRARVCSVAAGCLTAISMATTTPALAAGGSVTTNGHTLSVSTTTLAAGGQSVVVKGKGFDPRIGIYVTMCVIPPVGQQPTPCGGGVNMSGSSAASVWVSSNPPPYGAGLAKPFGKNGTFTVRLSVSSHIGDIDCQTTRCAIVTRADHTRPGDRRADVIVPVTFQ